MKIEIEATINVDIKNVWDFWTRPEHIINWNFASDDWHCPKASNDLQVGGKYFARMEAKDGSFGFELIAFYDEIETFQKLVYTMEDDRKVITTFKDDENITLVKTVFDAENENPIEMQKQGWQSILDNFKKYVESSKGNLIS